MSERLPVGVYLSSITTMSKHIYLDLHWEKQYQRDKASLLRTTVFSNTYLLTGLSGWLLEGAAPFAGVWSTSTGVVCTSPNGTCWGAQEIKFRTRLRTEAVPAPRSVMPCKGLDAMWGFGCHVAMRSLRHTWINRNMNTQALTGFAGEGAGTEQALRGRFCISSWFHPSAEKAKQT